MRLAPLVPLHATRLVACSGACAAHVRHGAQLHVGSGGHTGVMLTFFVQGMWLFLQGVACGSAPSAPEHQQARPSRSAPMLPTPFLGACRPRCCAGVAMPAAASASQCPLLPAGSVISCVLQAHPPPSESRQCSPLRSAQQAAHTMVQCGRAAAAQTTSAQPTRSPCTPPPHTPAGTFVGTLSTAPAVSTLAAPATGRPGSRWWRAGPAGHRPGGAGRQGGPVACLVGRRDGRLRWASELVAPPPPKHTHPTTPLGPL